MGGSTVQDPSRAQDPSAALGTATEWLRNISAVLLGSALVAVCARLVLPLSFIPVPLTLQPFAVLLLGMVLSPWLAATTLGAYLLEGLAGLPVFSPTGAALDGWHHLLGPTGGYLVAYPFAVYAISSLWRSSTRSLIWAFLSTVTGNLIILFLGALWFSVLSHASMETIFTEAVVPFLPGDALKVAVAATLGFEWYRLRRARPNV